MNVIEFRVSSSLAPYHYGFKSIKSTTMYIMHIHIEKKVKSYKKCSVSQFCVGIGIYCDGSDSLYTK